MSQKIYSSENQIFILTLSITNIDLHIYKNEANLESVISLCRVVHPSIPVSSFISSSLSFSLESTLNLLFESFSEYPLIIQCLSKERDRELGIAGFNLSPLINQISRLQESSCSLEISQPLSQIFNDNNPSDNSEAIHIGFITLLSTLSYQTPLKINEPPSVLSHQSFQISTDNYCPDDNSDNKQINKSEISKEQEDKFRQLCSKCYQHIIELENQSKVLLDQIMVKEKEKNRKCLELVNKEKTFEETKKDYIFEIENQREKEENMLHYKIAQVNQKIPLQQEESRKIKKKIGEIEEHIQQIDNKLQSILFGDSVNNITPTKKIEEEKLLYLEISINEYHQQIDDINQDISNEHQEIQNLQKKLQELENYRNNVNQTLQQTQQTFHSNYSKYNNQTSLLRLAQIHEDIKKIRNK